MKDIWHNSHWNYLIIEIGIRYGLQPMTSYTGLLRTNTFHLNVQYEKMIPLISYVIESSIGLLLLFIVAKILIVLLFLFTLIVFFNFELNLRQAI